MVKRKEYSKPPSWRNRRRIYAADGGELTVSAVGVVTEHHDSRTQDGQSSVGVSSEGMGLAALGGRLAGSQARRFAGREPAGQCGPGPTRDVMGAVDQRRRLFVSDASLAGAMLPRTWRAHRSPPPRHTPSSTC